MITQFLCVNLSSKTPKELVGFYNEVLEIPILNYGCDCDGASLGFLEDAPSVVIWDENKWGKSSEGSVNLVFICDDVELTYYELREKGVSLDPPVTASWGGKELSLLDPEGNKILLL